MRVMLSSDLPTLVPPYFCTTHGTLSSAGLRSSTSSYESGEAVPDVIWRRESWCVDRSIGCVEWLRVDLFSFRTC